MVGRQTLTLCYPCFNRKYLTTTAPTTPTDPANDDGKNENDKPAP